MINPNSFELLLNGKQLVKGGDADYPAFSCEGAEGVDESTCVGNSGVWVPSGQDYSLVFTDSVVTSIKFAQELESGDVVTIRWFNNDIGTLMDWEGTGGIKEKADKVYLNKRRRSYIDEPYRIYRL
ncbi:baseplate wedge subunit and tail pin [Klebsiella phage CPRSB]|nr:baseplate wedge subunit and tail pin [Klebsiella phage CPRSB]